LIFAATTVSRKLVVGQQRRLYRPERIAARNPNMPQPPAQRRPLHFDIRKGSIVILLVIIVAITNSFFIATSGIDKSPAPSGYSGSQACRSCHESIYKTHIGTAHFHDSGPANASTIEGDFSEGRNLFRYNAFMTVEMRNEGNQLMQVSLINGEEMTSAAMDIVIGSGRNGQTYLDWNGNQLFQLPISWYRAANAWCNSPGFPTYAFFNRKITLNCLECHTTSVTQIPDATSGISLDRSKMMYGIDCEKCHGAGAEHVNFQVTHPKDTIGRYIINTSKLSRQLRVDACALCHSGFRTAIRPPYTFTPGDTLANFSIGNPVSTQADTLDVHGNQYGLLSASKCYLNSPEMDCSTCHNVHETQYRQPALFSKACMNCHNADHKSACTLKTTKLVALSDNCIDCHMPVLASKNINLDLGAGSQTLPDSIRTHFISVYKKEAIEFLKKLD